MYLVGGPNETRKVLNMAKHSIETLISSLTAKARIAGMSLDVLPVVRVQGEPGTRGIAVLGHGDKSRALTYIAKYASQHLPEVWATMCSRNVQTVMYADGYHAVAMVDSEYADGEGMQAMVVTFET
jgi:hypothetical protein